VADYNQAVFDNGKKNEALNQSALDLKNVKADLVYMDPPYFSKHSDNDYVRRYHFIEGICRDWKGVEIQQDTLTKKFKKYESPFGTRDGAYAAFEQMITQFKNSKILISYSSNSLPSKDELIDMLKRNGKKVKTIEIDYKYSFGNQGSKVGDNNNQVKEYLFLGY
jgi:DNA adenine methylase